MLERRPGGRVDKGAAGAGFRTVVRPWVLAISKPQAVVKGSISNWQTIYEAEDIVEVMEDTSVGCSS